MMAKLIWMALTLVITASGRSGFHAQWIALAARVMWPIAPRLSDAVVHISAPWLHFTATSIT